MEEELPRYEDLYPSHPKDTGVFVCICITLMILLFVISVVLFSFS